MCGCDLSVQIKPKNNKNHNSAGDDIVLTCLCGWKGPLFLKIPAPQFEADGAELSAFDPVESRGLLTKKTGNYGRIDCVLLNSAMAEDGGRMAEGFSKIVLLNLPQGE